MNEDTAARAAHARSRWRRLGALGLVVAIVVLVTWTTIDLGFGLNLNVVNAVASIRSWGQWGVLGSIGLMVLHSFIPFPAEILACANGMVYGPVLGALTTWLGAMLGAVAAFGVTRRLGNRFVQRMLTPAQSERLVHWTEEQGAGAMLFSRLLPILAFNLVNYAAALAGIRWRTFLWTTGIGIVPMTILTAAFCDRVLTMPMWSWVVAGAILVLVIVLMHRTGRHREGRDAHADHR